MMRLKRFLGLYLLFICPLTILAQGNILSYDVQTIAEDFVDMSDALPTEILATVGEDEIYPVALPFPFQYFDTEYNTIFVSINGNASFGQPYSTLDYNREKYCFPQTNGDVPSNPDNFIMVNWDDLFIDATCTPAGGDLPKLAYRTLGTAPNRIFTVTWDYFVLSAPIPPCGATDPGTYLKAQLKLFEGSNNIEIHIPYNRMISSLDGSFSGPSIGVENLDGTYAKYVRCGRNQMAFENEAWRFTPSTVADPGDTNPDIYCAANGESCGDYGTIGEFTFNDITTANRGCEGGLGAEDRAYADNTDVVLEHVLGTPSTFSGTINNDLEIVAPIPSSVALWIDWNRDSTFSEDELSVGVNAMGDFTGNVVEPPVGAVPGLTRLRVRTYNTVNCNEIPEPCGQTCGNEVEDYTILVIDPANPTPNCPITANPADGANNLCQNDIFFNWNQPANVAADSFRIQVFAGGNSLIDEFTTDTFFNPANLLPANTNFDWIIDAYTGEQQSSACDTSSFSTAPVADPVVDIKPTGSPIFSCQGSNLQLNGVLNYPDNITHLWSGPAATFLSATNIENPEYNNPNEDTLIIYYEAENDFNCGGIDSAEIITLDGARLSAYSFPETSYCFGDSVIASVKGAIGEVVFLDSTDGNAFLEFSGTQLTDSTYLLPELSEGAHFIKLEVRLGDCDVLRDTIRIDIQSLPLKPEVQFVGSNGIVCQGETIDMEITNFEAGMFWSDTQNSATPTLSTNGSGQFFATNTQNGCSSLSDTLIAVVNPTPNPEIFRSDSAACFGDTLRLSIAFGFPSFKWDINTQDSIRREIRVIQDGTYTVTVTDANGCEGSNSEIVTFFSKPPKPTIAAIDENPACAGSEVRLVANYNVAGQWNTGETSDTLFVSEAGSFFYTSITDKGCATQSDDEIEVSFFPIAEKVKITVNPKAPYCIGDVVTLESPFQNGNLWSTGETSTSIQVAQSGNYSLQSTDNNGCDVFSDTLNLFFAQFPPKPSIIRNGNTLTADANASVYEWLLDGIPLNKNQRTITISANGTYTLRVFNASGCESEFSDPVQVSNVGLEELLAEMQVKIYPNPVTDGLLRLENNGTSDISMEMYLLDGRLIELKAIQPGMNQISLVDPGCYILKLKRGDLISTVQIISR